MHYSLLTAATLLAQTQAVSIPMPFGMGSVPINDNTNGHNTNGNGNIGGGMGMNHVNYYSSEAASSMAAPSSMATPAYMASSMGAPAPSMMPQYPALSAYQHKHHHYHMTPVASSSSHYINIHMSMHKSVSASASASKSMHIYAPAATPTPTHRASNFNALNKGLHAPHPHEGFSAPQGIPQAPDFTSENGASSQPGGYHGGNGNGFTQTHGGSDDGSSNEPAVYSDGSGPAMPGMPGAPSEEDGIPMPASFRPETEHVNQNVAPVPGTRPGEGNIAPVDSLAPGTNVAPTQPQKSHGADIGNAFCVGDCYASKEEAKCAQPYTTPLFQDAQGCYSCCFTSPDF